MKKTLIMAACLLAGAMFAADISKPLTFPAPERKPGQQSMINFRVPPIKNVRIAYIGCGSRGGSSLRRFACYPDRATIKVACDLWPEKLERIKKDLAKINYPHKVDYYTGPDDWKKICERDDIDLVYVATPVSLHAPIMIHALNNGKHVVSEVQLTSSIEDCWKIVDAAERNRKHCMILENCMYADYTLAVLNMIRKGMFGEAIHCEAGYIHNMEAYRFRNAKDNWRKIKKPSANPPIGGNGYPTHGLGPIAHWMKINRGDRMTTINSVATTDFTMRVAAAEKLGADSEFAKGHYGSDMTTDLIRTAKGKTIVLYYSTALRRPYNRCIELNATKGYTWYHANRKDRTLPRFSFAPDFENYLSDNKVKALLARERHPIVTMFEAEAKKHGGHGGVDTVMDMRLLYCLNNGLPLDMDVYDGVTWSSVVEASRLSCKLKGRPVELPDFTRGDWTKRNSVDYYYIDKDGKEKIY